MDGLHVAEAETSPVIKEKYVQANSRQTVRSPAHREVLAPVALAVDGRLGIRGSADAAAHAAAFLVSEPTLGKVTKLAEGGHQGARTLATSFVGWAWDS